MMATFSISVSPSLACVTCAESCRDERRSRAKVKAASRPMPPPVPVMIQTFSESLFGILLSSSGWSVIARSRAGLIEHGATAPCPRGPPGHSLVPIHRAVEGGPMRRAGERVKAKGGAKLPVAKSSRSDESSRIRDLEKRLAETLEQQTATSEILRVISSSPTHLHAALDTVAESAARLCRSSDAQIFRREGDRLGQVDHFGPIPSGPIGEFTIPLVRGTANGRSVLDERTVHVADLQAEADEFPEGSEFARRLGHRTNLSIPLMREGVAIGTICLRRTEVELFTERQVALLQIFAAQAVIAIENGRLFNETKEALEQQTATADILRVIASSPTDLQPVMDVVAESASRFCGAANAAIFRLEGESLRLVAAHGPMPAYTSIGEIIAVGPESVAGRAVRDRQTIHIEDMLALPETEFPGHVARARHSGLPAARTVLATLLLREGVPIGVIFMRRSEVQGFTDKQIELAKTFAAQAVIAIENVRLFTELEARNRELTE